MYASKEPAVLGKNVLERTNKRKEDSNNENHKAHLTLLLVVCMMLSIIPAVHAAAPTKLIVANIASGSAKVAQDLQAAIKSGKADGSGIYADVDKNEAMPSSVKVVTNTNGITQEGFYIFAEDGKMIL